MLKASLFLLFLDLSLKFHVVIAQSPFDPGVIQEVISKAVPLSNTALAAVPVAVHYVTTSVRCSSECAKVGCESFNYNKEFATCELLDTYLCEDLVELETREGFKYYDVITADEVQPTEDYSLYPSCINDGRCLYKCYETISTTTTVSTTPSTTPSPTDTTTTVPITTLLTMTSGQGEVSIYEDCTGDQASCTAANSECNVEYGHCQCTAGYSFKPSTGECVTTCDTPGDFWGVDFTRTVGFYIYTNNQETFADCNLVCCMSKCLSYTTATCKSFDHNWQLDKCYLSVVTKLEVPEHDWSENPFFDYYQRNCA